jgi:hypothetical protein
MRPQSRLTPQLTPTVKPSKPLGFLTSLLHVWLQVRIMVHVRDFGILARTVSLPEPQFPTL